MKRMIEKFPGIDKNFSEITLKLSTRVLLLSNFRHVVCKMESAQGGSRKKEEYVKVEKEGFNFQKGDKSAY